MRRIFFMLIAAVMSGCAVTPPRSDVNLYDTSPYAATSAETVKVFQQRPAGRDYVELGEIRVERAEEWDEVARVFREKAAEAGGDAVYVLDKLYEEKTYHRPFDGAYPSYDFMYGHHHWGYRFYYPQGFYTDSQTLITATGVIIRFRD